MVDEGSQLDDERGADVIVIWRARDIVAHGQRQGWTMKQLHRHLHENPREVMPPIAVKVGDRIVPVWTQHLTT